MVEGARGMVGVGAGVTGACGEVVGVGAQEWGDHGEKIGLGWCGFRGLGWVAGVVSRAVVEGGAHCGGGGCQESTLVCPIGDMGRQEGGACVPDRDMGVSKKGAGHLVGSCRCRKWPLMGQR